MAPHAQSRPAGEAVPQSVTIIAGVCGPERSWWARRIATARGDRYLPVSAADGDLFEAIDILLTRELAGGGSASVTGFVLDLDSALPTLEAISAVEDVAALTGAVVLTGCHTVVDASHLRADLASEDYFAFELEGDADAEVDDVDRRHFVSRAVTAVRQIEHSTSVLLVGWSGLDRDEVAAIMAIVSHLSPTAVVRPVAAGGELRLRDGAGFRASDAGVSPGWVRMLNDEFDPVHRHDSVSTFRYENLRPFHANRLIGTLNRRLEAGEFGTVIRSAGFCRIAQRPGVLARWSQAGSMIGIEPDGIAISPEEAPFGQDLVFTGIDLDHAALTAALDDCVVTDAEFRAGPELWALLPDPLPEWADSAVDRDEGGRAEGGAAGSDAAGGGAWR